MATQPKTIIGRAERIDFPELGLTRVPAKTDTGADASSIWASAAKHEDGHLLVTFFGEGSEFYTGVPVVFEEGSFTLTRVANSFGHRETRYRVKLQVRVNGRLVRASFTLANRSNKTYPILLGRKLLSGKFLVDVQQGEPLLELEQKKRAALQRAMKKLSKGASV